LGIKDEGFRNAAIFATTLWKNLGYSEQACSELINQLKRFDQKLKPYDLSYDINVDHPQIWWGSIRHKPRYIQDLALRLFGIIPSQANCERNFSALKWMMGDRRTRLDVKKLEGMSKIRSYYLASIKEELLFYGKDLDENELREVAANFAVGKIIALDNENGITNDLLNETHERIQKRKGKEVETQITLALENVIDLTCSFDNVENVNLENYNMNEEIGNMDFNPIDLVNQLLNNRN